MRKFIFFIFIFFSSAYTYVYPRFRLHHCIVHIRWRVEFFSFIYCGFFFSLIFIFRVSDCSNSGERFNSFNIYTYSNNNNNNNKINHQDFRFLYILSFYYSYIYEYMRCLLCYVVSQLYNVCLYTTARSHTYTYHVMLCYVVDILVSYPLHFLFLLF